MKTPGIFLLIFVVSSVFFACNGNADFLIAKGRVGKLNKNTKVKDLARIFKDDSLVVDIKDIDENSPAESKYFREDDQYIVYSKEGKHLLTITPLKQHDSSATLKSIEIFSNRYKTKKGISLYSPYKDIHASYALRITNTLSSAHIDIDELNATMTIPKKEIGINEFNREKIRLDQIPDLAKISHFTVWFH